LIYVVTSVVRLAGVDFQWRTAMVGSGSSPDAARRDARVEALDAPTLHMLRKCRVRARSEANCGPTSSKARAQSFTIRQPPANNMTSLTTSRPPPDSQGKPYGESPSAGTQASGRRTQERQVPSGVRNASVAPNIPYRREKSPTNVRRPIIISTEPSPFENL
jgi:hypothetical protein